jgi:hypothetical protein
MKRSLIYFFLAISFFLKCKKENENTVIKQISTVRGYQNWYFDNFRCGLFVPTSYGFAIRCKYTKDNKVWYCGTTGIMILLLKFTLIETVY